MTPQELAADTVAQHGLGAVRVLQSRRRAMRAQRQRAQEWAPMLAEEERLDAAIEALKDVLPEIRRVIPGAACATEDTL